MPRLGFGFGRIAQGAGDALEPVAEKSVDRLLAGPLPEAVAQSIVRHHVLERVVREIVATTEFRAAFTAALGDERTEELVEEVAKSPLLARLIEDAVSSPAVRAALTEQTTSIGKEMVGSLRGTAVRADAAVERPLRRWSRKPARPLGGLEGAYAGVASRGLALVLDVLIAELVYLIAAATVGLVASLTVGVERSWVYGALAAAGWLLVQGAYFVGFWSAAGRTPGMALMGLRLRDARNRRPGVIRSSVRLVGLWLAISFVLIGFLPALIDDRRRALQDFLAGTEVVYSSGEGEVRSPAGEGGWPG
jgi:uncharacterized RDD family membrane protein YckC